MAIDPIWIWIAGGAVVAIAIVAFIASASRRSRSASLRDQFGTEYERTVRETKSRSRAEKDLLARREEANTYEIRPLTATERSRYRGEWAKIEARFLERPTTAVVEADELVADIMRVQGYPVGDFEKHASDLSVRHPRVVEHYRAGHAVMIAKPGSSTTEDLRQSMLHYRSLFDEMVGSEKTDVVIEDVPRASEVAAAPRVVERRDDLGRRDADKREH